MIKIKNGSHITKSKCSTKFSFVEMGTMKNMRTVFNYLIINGYLTITKQLASFEEFIFNTMSF